MDYYVILCNMRIANIAGVKVLSLVFMYLEMELLI
jgi:hypothetical protein